MRVRRLPSSRAKRGLIALLVGAAFLATPAALYRGLDGTSALQARYFADLARDTSFRVAPGRSPAIRFPLAGPYDERLGYTRLAAFIDRLEANGFSIAAQARWSPRLQELVDWGLFAPYREKPQAGLEIVDRDGERLFALRYPERVLRRYEDIPPLIVETLLFIENRKLFDGRPANYNPAVDADRLAKAALDRVVRLVDADHRISGGSTLATQIEKFRHSQGGRTTSPGEKLRQMASASVRAYLDGEETLARRRQIVLDYVNSVPLGGRPPHGEVHGLGDALWAWYGRELGEVAQLLAGAPSEARELRARALAYKQVLSLMLAQRQPSVLLGRNGDRLEALTNRYLRLLAHHGVIDARLMDEALRAQLELRPEISMASAGPAAARKGADAVRAQLARVLDVPRRYDLDRLDLRVHTTLDRKAQEAVTRTLLALRNRGAAKAAGLDGERLLARGDPAKVVYSVILYERTEDAFVVRVHADSLEQPFDVNESMKLDLGSTAKLRTLATYLEIVARLHERFGALDAATLRSVQPDPDDALTCWALGYLAAARDRRLAPMLEAALERRYPASPRERFFTAGGLHAFANFRREDDAKLMSVREAFRDSVNLVFVRLMRDIVRYHIHEAGLGAVLRDKRDPRRLHYLMRFAEEESRAYVEGFYRRQTKSAGKTHAHPLGRWTAQYLRTHPQATLAELLEASAAVRRESYRWLLANPHKAAHDRRIRSVLESDAFAAIHRDWKRLGYPFDALVPSYATALGNSADRPAALAELVGTILSGGVRLPVVRMTRLEFAAGTPYETGFEVRANGAERVMAPEVAALLRRALEEVVADGTARRARAAFRATGDPTLVLGGKTGTADHRWKVYGPRAQLLESRPVNRAAAFAFFVGERFFGTVTAYVAGPDAASYRFTSALPVQLLKVLEPALAPLISPRDDGIDRLDSVAA